MGMIDWTDAFDNSGYVAGARSLPDKWRAEAAAFRGGLPAERCRLDQPYGPGPREALDWFLPEGPPLGTFVFLHGGYWHMFDKSYWSHLAEGALARGWAVAMPSYPLAPEARISEITRSIVRAVTWVAAETDGPLRLAGHSAGGHLVARMACTGVLPAPVAGRIARVTSISGLHQLLPLTATQMNATLRLTEAEAIAESPVTHAPAPGVPVTFWVGDAERPEFLRQNRIGAEVWGRAGADVRQTYASGHNHFTVVTELADLASPLTQEVLR